MPFNKSLELVSTIMYKQVPYGPGLTEFDSEHAYDFCHGVNQRVIRHRERINPRKEINELEREDEFLITQIQIDEMIALALLQKEAEMQYQIDSLTTKNTELEEAKETISNELEEVRKEFDAFKEQHRDKIDIEFGADKSSSEVKPKLLPGVQV
jgi:hypothetical protein